ncbi:MAG: glycine--tRNA ligase subunit beta, partial [Bacillota bacterium]|nr:glycine--tRNA ligase subunit beta [Bacillota bacterium]
MAKDLLLEIGTEEIPAGFMERALADLQTLAIKELGEYRLAYNEVQVYGTPRRLALYIAGLADAQADMEEEAKGPSKKVGMDENGGYTKAA